MNTVNYSHFADEVQYNLDIMKETIASGKGSDIDPGFLAIFRADIATLRKSSIAKNRVRVLSKQLQNSGAKLKKIWNKEIKTKEIKQPAPIEFFAAYTPTEVEKTLSTSARTDAVAAGYNTLAQSGQYLVRKIPGDGHCLFTSVAAIDLYSAQRMGMEPKLLTTAKRIAEDETLDNELLKTAATMVADLLSRQVSDNEAFDPKAILADVPSRTHIIQFLRSLACHELRQDTTNETLDQYLAANGTTRHAHLASMEDIRRRAHGDEPELHAMRHALDLELPVIDLQTLGIEQTTLPENHEQGKLWLLFRPGHYDVAEGC